MVEPGLQAILELFDKKGSTFGFTDDDKRILKAAAKIGADLLRQALVHQQAQQLLFNAVAAALKASEDMTQTLEGSTTQRLEQPPPATVINQLRQGLETPTSAVDSEDTLRLAEAIRVLVARHGSPAAKHCIRLLENVKQLLDEVNGS